MFFFFFFFKGCMKWQTESSKTWSTSFPLFLLHSLHLILRLINPVLSVSSTRDLIALKYDWKSWNVCVILVRKTFIKLSHLLFRAFYETHASGLQQAVFQSGLQVVQVPAALLPQSLRQAGRWAAGFGSAGRWRLRHGPHQHWGHCRGQNRKRRVGHPPAWVRASVSDAVTGWNTLVCCNIFYLQRTKCFNLTLSFNIFFSVSAPTIFIRLFKPNI